MELQEIKKGVDTRIGNRNESGRDKKKTDTVFSYCLAGINVWVFGKKLGNNGLAYLAAAFLVFCFFGYLPVKMSRIVLAGFLGAEVSKDNIKTYPKCEGI